MILLATQLALLAPLEILVLELARLALTTATLVTATGTVHLAI